MGIRKDLIEQYGNLPILRRHEILQRINSISGDYELRDKALIASLYLCGCRVEELVKYIIERNPHKIKTTKRRVFEEGHELIYVERTPDPIMKRMMRGFPVIKDQFEIWEDKIIVTNVRCLKNRKVHSVRNIPIVVNRMEQPFIDVILDYLDTLEDDTPLFNFSRTYAYKICSRVELFPHYLIHLRCTHLATDYGFTDMQLMKFRGWTDTRPAKVYTHLNVDDLVEKMKK